MNKYIVVLCVFFVGCSFKVGEEEERDAGIIDYDYPHNYLEHVAGDAGADDAGPQCPTWVGEFTGKYEFDETRYNVKVFTNDNDLDHKFDYGLAKAAHAVDYIARVMGLTDIGDRPLGIFTNSLVYMSKPPSEPPFVYGAPEVHHKNECTPGDYQYYIEMNNKYSPYTMVRAYTHLFSLYMYGDPDYEMRRDWLWADTYIDSPDFPEKAGLAFRAWVYWTQL